MSLQQTDFSCKKIKFLSDSFLLSGILHMPQTAYPPVVIGSHGLFSDGNSSKQIALVQACNECGIAFFRFNHRGCGESEGKFNEVTSLKGRCTDLIRAIETMRSQNNMGKPLGLFGSSMGGAVCLSVACQTDIDAMVTVAAPLRSGPVIEAIKKSGDTSLSESLLNPAQLEFDISSCFQADRKNRQKIRNILIFHGDKDETVPFSDAHEIYENAGEPKKLIVQKNGDHRITDPAHQEEFIRETANWFQSLLIKK